MMKPRVLLADDHTLLLEAFEKLLAEEYDVVGRVADGLQMLELAPQVLPDVVVIDVAMPRLNGLDAARQLHALMPRVKILFLTMNEDADTAAEAFKLGASGYLLKRSAASELLLAIHEVLHGRFYITPLLTRDLVGSFIHDLDRDKPGRHLTARQREVLQLTAEGHSMKEIARILNVADRTVAFHKYRMMETLQIRTTAQLIQFAVREGVV